MGNLIASPSTVTSTDQVHRARVWLTIALSLTFIAANRSHQSTNQSSNYLLSVISNRHLTHRINDRLSQLDPLTLVSSTLLFSYILKHLSLLCHLNAPITSLSTEPDMHYSPSFSRARHFLNAWDAAILSTLHMDKYPYGIVQFMRHTISTFLAMYYIVQPHQAEEKVTRFRAAMTVDQLRAIWQKGVEHPVLRMLNRIGKTKLCCEGTPIMIEGVRCNLYYDRPINQLANETCLILDFPGGGFVAMDHRNHSDYLCYWASKLRVPILVVNMRKAPEHAFPAGLDDCYDVYESLIESEGVVAGLNIPPPNKLDIPPPDKLDIPPPDELDIPSPGTQEKPNKLRIALVGDSAGGNLASAVVLRAIESGLRVPDGVHLIYPCLDIHCELWRPSIHSDRSKVIDGVIKMQKDEQDRVCVTCVRLDQSSDNQPVNRSENQSTSHQPVEPINQRASSVEISSHARYLWDGCLPTSYSVLICSSYLAAGGDPDHYYVSPLHAPADMLSKFPPVYIHVGEVDPLFDDSIRFITQVRAAHHAIGDTKYESELFVIPKVSHAYMHIASLLHEAREAIQLSESWLRKILKLQQQPSSEPTNHQPTLHQSYSSRHILDKIENNPVP